MGFSRNELKIAALHASGATRTALEAIAGGEKGGKDGDGSTEKQLANGRRQHVRGQVSGAEQRYFDACLAPRIQIGEVVKCEHEDVRFKLGHGASYTPDWNALCADWCVEHHEVKGTEPADRDRDSRNRWKWAATLNPDDRWIYAKEQAGGGFKVETIEPRTRRGEER